MRKEDKIVESTVLNSDINPISANKEMKRKKKNKIK